MPKIFEKDGFKTILRTLEDKCPYQMNTLKVGTVILNRPFSILKISPSKITILRNSQRQKNLPSNTRILSWKSGMNILTDRAKYASYSNGYVSIVMESELEYRFPIAGNPRLQNGTERELNNIEISPCGLHWPDLDEDLSFQGIAKGNFGQRKK